MSRKENRKKRRGKRQGRNLLNGLKRKMEAEFSSSGTELGWQTSNPEKMSAVILDLADPLLETAPDDDSAKTAIAVAILAWNISLPESGRADDLIDKTAKTVAGPDLEAVEEIKECINALITRKKDLYPDNKRYILGYEFISVEGQLRLNVASTVMPPEGDNS